ncbi:hypothetical protein [Cardinium endosymbiont of Bemisia tabaci]|uniref:hypothetical protein n=1 Tax=Cardinium endosymbiont of Bemisia tabaci TaxID=672794 RepID=UPI000442D349|nr:hypothetical protein [Cardinium endosymbiont of Bemisia tabaci]CDG49604.1 Hypothetical protein CHV_a0286 [Cardinium endosymbiont cBtQ1 of Bemisia tabaci]
MICVGELGPDGCYATTCCKQMPLHIDCIADSAIASYNSMAGKDPNPQYKCPFCSRSLF